MPNNQSQLEDKFRRSSTFHSMPNLQDYLEYARSCRDQIQNHIHTQEIEYWLSMLNALKQRCEFKLIIKKLLQIKKNATLREHPHYHKILHFEDTLTQQLENDIRKKKHKKRRSLQQFQLFSISKIQKKKRKVGGIQIYVDEDCRDNYKLEDYSEFYVNNMKQDLEARRYEYDRRQERKGLSFLGMHEYNIQKWSIQLIDLKNIIKEQGKQHTGIRQSSVCKGGYNGEKSNANNSKRFSISRRSNVNIVNENNPQIGYKTPKESIYINTPIKNKCHHQSVNKQQQIATPPRLSKHYINDKSLLKACRKSERHERKPRYSSSQQSSNHFNKQLFGTTTIDYFDDNNQSLNSLDYPQHKEVIRLNIQRESQEINIQGGKLFGNEQKGIFGKKEDKLDLGCVQWSQVQDDKGMDVEGQIDRQLKQTIFMAQLDKIDNLIDNKHILFHIDSTPISSMNCQQDPSLDQSLSQFQNSSIGVVMCLKSTQTLQSIDSNQQNLFSIHKRISNSQSSHHLHVFRKDRKLFQTIPIEDKTFIITNDSNQSADLQIQKVNDGEMMSLQGNDQIQQMIDQMDTGQHEYHTNLVLQTLRKKKLSELLMNQIIREDQKEHNFGTHSQKKSMLNVNGLKYISQQKSYNSEKRYNSRERFSSGCFGDFS